MLSRLLVIFPELIEVFPAIISNVVFLSFSFASFALYKMAFISKLFKSSIFPNISFGGSFILFPLFIVEFSILFIVLSIVDSDELLILLILFI